MMKKFIFYIFIFLITQSSFSQSYYWFQGKKVQITENKDLFYISSDDSLSLVNVNKNMATALVSSVKYSGSFRDNQKKYWSVIQVKNKTKSTVPLTAKSIGIAINSNAVFVAPVYGTTDDNSVPTSEYFYVKLKSLNDYTVLQTEVNKNACKIVKSVPYMSLWYLLKAPRTSNGISMANAFYETSKFSEVDPGFMFDFKPNCVSDPSFNNQWALKNSNNIDIKACDAWSITKGSSSVLTGVLDQGIDQDHKEFSSNYNRNLSYDILNGTSPSIVRGNHGTHVGGIIGANHNGIQVAGIAPGTSLVSISHSLSVYPGVSGELASGFGYARDKGIAILNNSWGDHNGTHQNLHSAVLEDAIKSALVSGRGGKGMIIVFAAGNMNVSKLDYPGSISPDILTVGSIDSSGKRSSFSSYGEGLDVVAPGGNILSTLPSNSIGYMSGTSMAAPYAAGVAALVLAVNPNLTGREVRDIIESTTQKVGGYSYTNQSGKTNGTWNSEMGYGLINAYAAVVKAKNGNSCTTTNFTNRSVNSNESVTCTNINVTNVVVNANAKLTLTSSGTTVINAPFTINKNGLFELKNK